MGRSAMISEMKKRNVDWRQINEMMSDTFPLQRKEIVQDESLVPTKETSFKLSNLGVTLCIIIAYTVAYWTFLTAISQNVLALHLLTGALFAGLDFFV